METGFLALAGVLVFIILLLHLKIRLMQKAAEEISSQIACCLATDTNTLLTISSRDRYIRKLADGLNVQLRSLRRERLRFQQGNIEVAETVTNISHDLRTPLTAICGYLDLLKKIEKSDDEKRYLSIIEERVEALKQLTEEFFRYFAGSLAITEGSLELVSLNGALEEILSAFYASLKSCKIIPRVSIPEEKIVRRLNKNALSRIFGNIISNAMKYSGGDLDITLRKNGEILFSNHAPGLNELQALRLFDRFYTVETAAKSTGIGLSIAKELTEQMNGSISARVAGGVLSISIYFPENQA